MNSYQARNDKSVRNVIQFKYYNMINNKKQKVVFLVLFVLMGVVFAVGEIAKADTPIVTAFEIPATSDSLTVPIITFTGSDGILVTGFYVSEGSFAPAVDDGAWAPTAPVSFTFATSGSKTLYAWVKDALGNVSLAASGSVMVGPDLVAPAAPGGLGVQ